MAPNTCGIAGFVDWAAEPAAGLVGAVVVEHVVVEHVVVEHGRPAGITIPVHMGVLGAGRRDRGSSTAADAIGIAGADAAHKRAASSTRSAAIGGVGTVSGCTWVTAATAVAAHARPGAELDWSCSRDPREEGAAGAAQGALDCLAATATGAIAAGADRFQHRLRVYCRVGLASGGACR